MPLSEPERLARLRLIRTDNVGPATFASLIERCGSAVDALDQIGDLSQRGGRARPLEPAPLAKVEREWNETHKAGACFVMVGDEAYPLLLSVIEPAPPVMTALGHAHLMSDQTIAMVGARNASANAKKIARTMATELGRAGYTVVSGMARGIDTAAHDGALANGTIAVLAGGVTSIYPQENEALYHAISEQGLIVSEMPLGHIGRAKDFPRRNRIISGLSQGVIVVEAALRSGSLITARNALEQSREVFAVPGSPLDPRCRGANHLIKEGAALVEDADDVIAAIESFTASILGDPSKDKNRSPAPPMAVPDVELSKWRDLVMGALSPSPTEVDEIIRETQCPAGIISILLLELDLAGRLERHPGGRVALVL